MKVLLHIGQSKTGTSAIQAFLTLNRERLREHRILYPAARVNGMTLNLGAHNAVADTLLGLVRFPRLSADEYFEQFFEDARKINADQMILSAEHFFGGEPRIWDVRDEADYFERYREKIRRLARYLTGHEVTILVYLRPQVDWLASAVSQTVRIERLISQRQIYQNDQQFFELMKPLLKYADLLDAWRDGIKPVSLVAVPYLRDALYKRSSVADFLRRTQLDAIGFQYADENIQVNESLNREFIEVKKRLNRTPRSKNMERTVIRCMENLSRISPKTSEYVFAAEVTAEIEALVLEQNTRISNDYITGGQPFVASSSKKQAREILNEADIDQAQCLFETEFRRPKYGLLHWSYVLRAFLRKYAKPVQAALHQIKALYWAWKYKR